MICYDTIYAKNKGAADVPVGNMYAADQSFELIKRVPKKYMHLSDDKLSKIYGVQDD